MWESDQRALKNLVFFFSSVAVDYRTVHQVKNHSVEDIFNGPAKSYSVG